MGAQPKFQQYPVNLRCSKCGNKGMIIWEGTGAQKSLVWLSGSFYERLSRKPPYAIELVCVKCGALHLE